MTAASFPNLSFENPPGTGPTLVSVVEPFELADGDQLELTLAGQSYSVVMLAPDFANISTASADEVAALVELRVPDIGAANDGGAVRLTSLLTGEDVTLEVTGGLANLALGFPAGAVSGTTYAGGPPDGWTVSSEVDSVFEWAAFADENTRPEEVFAAVGWALVVVTDDLTDALFDLALVPTPTETFTGWVPYGFLVSVALVAGSFGVNPFEAFESGWGSPTYFAFLPAHLQTGGTDPFETGWGQGGAALFDDADFATGLKSAEDFAGVIDTTHVIEIITAAAGEWSVRIDSEVYAYPATGGDTPTSIATDLADKINTGSVRAAASNAFGILSIWPTSKDTTLSVSATRPSGGTLASFVAPDYPAFADNWTGQDQTPDFD